MPTEVTEQYIRVEVRPSGDFQEDSLRTITLSEEEGIKAIIGKLPDETKTTISVYLFDKEKWTVERAEAWVTDKKQTKTGLSQFLLEAAYKAEGERKKLQTAQEARAAQYGIAVKEQGALFPTRGYPEKEEDYGDPVNYNYPLTEEFIRATLRGFNQEGPRDYWGYTEGERDVIGPRIAEGATRLLEAGYQYADGEVSQSGGEGEEEPEEEGKSHVIKTLDEDEGGVIVGGHLLLWGEPSKRDLQRQFFTQSTELWLKRYPVVPALFHHGLDPSVGPSVIGHRLKAQVDEVGVWVKHWLDKSNKFWAWVRPLLDAEALHYSPGSASHLVQADKKTGEILAYPIVEDTLTPIPAQHRMEGRPVSQLKAIYQAANLALPDIGGGDSEELRRKKAQLRADLLRLNLELSGLLLK